MKMAKDTLLKIGEFEIRWLDGGSFELDGGAMFGVVPKVLWERRYPTSSGNNILLLAHPILIKTPEHLVLVETGLGNKLTDKQKKIFNLRSPWKVPVRLRELGLSTTDIDYVVLTHCDFDHAGGLLSYEDDQLVPTFPEARYVIQRTEWEDVKNPNIRSRHTFWPVNFQGIEETGNLMLVEGALELFPGITLKHTGGHNRGHQIIRIESNGEVAIYAGDLLPTHVHYNPLWVMSYDNYPLDTIRLKEEIEKEALRDNAWFLFYHDPFLRACKFNESGTESFFP